MISVILVTYNSVAVLPNCIRSLEDSSSAEKMEIIVADNSSVDGTVEWLRRYEQDAIFPFEQVKILTLKENLGYSYANNRAMELAQGDILLFLNPDTVVGSDAIVACVAILAERDNVGAVGCRLILPSGKLDKACKRSFPTFWNSFSRFVGLSFLFPTSRWFSQYNLTYLSDSESYPVDCLSGAFLMIPKVVKEVVGGFDDDYFMYGEDIDWCYRIKQAGYEIWYEGKVSTVHVKGGNGGKRSPESLKHFYDSMFLYYVKTRDLSSHSIRAKFLRGAVFLLGRFSSVARRLRNLR